MGYKIFTRKQLYDLLTEIPITRLAKEYDLPYLELKDVCDDNDIPYRSGNDWYRLGLGEEVYRAPLGGDPDKTVSIRMVIRPDQHGSKQTGTRRNTNNHVTVSQRLAQMRKERETYKTDRVRGKKTYRVDNKNDRYFHETDSLSRWNKEADTQPAGVSDMDIKPDPVDISTQEITKRIDETPDEATLYQMFSVRPNAGMYSRIEIADVVSTVRAKNVLMRNHIVYLHDLFSLTYDGLRCLRNNGIQTTYQILKDVMKYIELHALLKETDHEEKSTVDEEEKPADDEPAVVQEVTDSADAGTAAEKDQTVELLIAFNQLNRKGKQTLVDTAKAFTSLEKFTKND